eukprot:TRINITY_DN4058_c0_g1_i2.p1 TRINITY_DN4058_c0_g1~~TRINITY_DN4058_c0_g1_i2.p1  ORF type:complete len:150 (-),score=4.68 TRINITY_DN4058_c0_g1_i2:9-458(-)
MSNSYNFNPMSYNQRWMESWNRMKMTPLPHIAVSFMAWMMNIRRDQKNINRKFWNEYKGLTDALPKDRNWMENAYQEYLQIHKGTRTEETLRSARFAVTYEAVFSLASHALGAAVAYQSWLRLNAGGMLYTCQSNGSAGQPGGEWRTGE